MSALRKIYFGFYTRRLNGGGDSVDEADMTSVSVIERVPPPPRFPFCANIRFQGRISDTQMCILGKAPPNRVFLNPYPNIEIQHCQIKS